MKYKNKYCCPFYYDNDTNTKTIIKTVYTGITGPTGADGRIG